MKLTVHIGSAKTGSTSVQAFLLKNKDLFAKNGIYLPDCFRFQNHTAAALACMPYESSVGLVGKFGVKNSGEFEVFRKKTIAEFDLELDRLTPDAHVVITSEHLQSRLKNLSLVQEFQARFASRFEAVEIVLYLRAQADMLVSLYSTLLRNNHTASLPETTAELILQQDLPYYDFQALIQRWSAAFGVEAMNVRAHRALDMANGGAVTDFCDVLGVPRDDPAYIRPKLANASINKAAQDMLCELNKVGCLTPKIRRSVVTWMEVNAPGKGATLDAETTTKFQSRFAVGNKWVADNYFPDHPEYLQPLALLP